VVREALDTRLRSHVGTTADPEYAFELVLKKQYDRLIFDLTMPGIGGDLLYSLILKVYDILLPSEHRIPPVILISGNVHEKGAQDFRLMPGVRALVPKPFTIQRLSPLGPKAPCYLADFLDGFLATAFVLVAEADATEPLALRSFLS